MLPGQVFYPSFSGNESASGASSPRAALSPGCRERTQALRAALVQRTVWAAHSHVTRLCHTHGAAPSEWAWDGKSKSPQCISGFASTGQQRVKNRAKNEGGGLKYYFFFLL